MTSKSEPIHRGTLVCVVLKAKNLPNKKSIGKQDPYCTLSLGTSVQKTKPDKRGGQHPTWDEQLHFEIYDDMEDQLKNASEVSGSSEATSSSAMSRLSRGKGSKTLKVACYADDTKDPEFIGDGVVDLTETLKTGEFDEWVTIKAKDRYAGEVYLELTFYSSAVPPKRKKPGLAQIPSGTIYGGAGTFSEDLDEPASAPKPVPKETSHAPIPSYMRPESQIGISASTSGRFASTSAGSQGHYDLIPPSQSVPISLRPSSSLAQLDTYTPPYAPPRIQREKSPAPTSYLEQRRMSIPTTTHSSNAQFHAHRLSDAVAPAASMQSHQHYYQGAPMHQQGVDNMIGSMSTMSVGNRPGTIEAPNAFEDYNHQNNGPPQNYSAGPTGIPFEQYGRPALTASTQSYHPASSLTPIPTPPPPSTSAPPGVPAYPSQPPAQWLVHKSPPNQTFISSPYSLPSPAPQMIAQGRPASPLVGGAVPSRPLTAGGYHALPQPPNAQPLQTQQLQQGHPDYGNNYSGNPQIANDYMGPGQHYPQASPSHPNRPLPPTSSTQVLPPSPSTHFAPPASFYPPPAQTPSHYVGPPPSMQWPQSQEATAIPHNAYSSYPPPPPGPINGDYVHPSPLQVSPSSHPGQYPPPPPIHQVDYSHPTLSLSHLQHQYYNQPMSQSSTHHALNQEHDTMVNPHSTPQAYHHTQAQYPHK